MKKSETRPTYTLGEIGWVKCLWYYLSSLLIAHNPPHDACLWMAKLECKLSVLIEKTTSIPAISKSNPLYFKHSMQIQNRLVTYIIAQIV